MHDVAPLEKRTSQASAERSTARLSVSQTMPLASSIESVLALQRAVGNRAVTRLLQRKQLADQTGRPPGRAEAADAGMTVHMSGIVPAQPLSTMLRSAVELPASEPARQAELVAPPSGEASSSLLVVSREPAPGSPVKTPPQPTTAAAPPTTKDADPKRDLAKAVIGEQRQGGITVAAYAVGVKAASEFKRQAEQFAEDHGAYGLAGGTLQRGVAMALTQSLPSILRSVSQEITTLLAAYPDLSKQAPSGVKVRILAVFTHGEKNQLQAAVDPKPDRKWILKSLVPWVEAITPYLSKSPRVDLYACLTGGQPAKGVPFAEAMRQALQTGLKKTYGAEAGVNPEVWGHSTAGTATANKNWVMFGGEAATSAGVALKSTLGRRLAALAIEQAGRADQLSASQAARLERQCISAMESVLAANPAKTDPTNAFIREIPQMGIDRVWRGLSTEAIPDLSDLGITAEAQARVVEGLTTFRSRFVLKLAALTKVAGKLKPPVPK